MKKLIQKISKKWKELGCLFAGHKWKSEFDPKIVTDKKFKERLYCKRCKVYHHEHEYKKG